MPWTSTPPPQSHFTISIDVCPTSILLLCDNPHKSDILYSFKIKMIKYLGLLHHQRTLGLDLSISPRIIESMQGSIAVENAQ